MNDAAAPKPPMTPAELVVWPVTRLVSTLRLAIVDGRLVAVPVPSR